MNRPCFGSRSDPAVVVFGGGSAPGPLVRALARHTRRGLHLVTPFDSGGSSGELRRVFGGPAVGDLRARLLALADPNLPRLGELSALLEYRLPCGSLSVARTELEHLLDGSHPLMRELASYQRRAVCAGLHAFAALAEDVAARDPNRRMDLRGACIGNLTLFGWGAGRSERAAGVLGRLLRTRGTALLLADTDAHLCARLADGREVAGQHRFTGKYGPPPDVPVRELRLCIGPDDPSPARVAIAERLRRRITAADLICFPPGSFHSSVLACLLPEGVGRAVASATCAKVFIPNPTSDPELLGYTVEQQVERLQQAAARDAGPGKPGFPSHVLADSRESRYPGGLPEARLAERGVRLVREPLITPESEPFLDPDRVCTALLCCIETVS